MYSLSIDFSAFGAGIRALLDKVEKQRRFSALDIGYEIMRLSQGQVPHDKGTLQNSGNVEPVGEDVVIGYHTPYAARLHEHPEYHFQKGRKGKYLEDPIKDNMEKLGIDFTTSFGSGING